VAVYGVDHFLTPIESISRAAKNRFLQEKPDTRLHKGKTRKTKKARKESLLTAFPLYESIPAHPSYSEDQPSDLPRIRHGESSQRTNLRDPNCTLVWNHHYEGLLVSEPHHVLPNGKWSGGGPFYQYTADQQHTSGGTVTAIRNGNISSANVCGVSGVPIGKWPSIVPPGMPSIDEVAESVRAPYAEGYARTRPGNPVASLGQFIIELRDVPTIPFRRALGTIVESSRLNGTFSSIPKVLYKELLNFRNLGSEYLNHVFGWKPFVKDLQGMYNLWKTVDRQMAQIVRDNGKSIRRKARLKDERGITQSSGRWDYPGVNLVSPPPGWIDPAGTVWNLTTRWSEQVWFSGTYRYYIPDTESSQWDARARAALFGALPTPSLLWEVLPWTWLFDWFANVGDIVSNASTNAVDNLVTDHAHVMRQIRGETSARVLTWSQGARWGTPMEIGGDYPSYDISVESRISYVLKSRSHGGNPFGPNADLGALTSHQLGILAALGYARS